MYRIVTTQSQRDNYFLAEHQSIPIVQWNKTSWKKKTIVKCHRGKYFSRGKSNEKKMCSFHSIPLFAPTTCLWFQTNAVLHKSCILAQGQSLKKCADYKIRVFHMASCMLYILSSCGQSRNLFVFAEDGNPKNIVYPKTTWIIKSNKWNKY